eukprot:6132004-Amphidinium_carterae.1
MNLTGEEHPRVIAIFSPAELTWALNSWTADGVAPPPGIWAQAGVIGRVCRLVCGRPVEEVAPLLGGVADQPSFPPQSSAPEQPQRTVRISHIADQTNDTEVKLLSTDAIATYYK